MQKQILSFFFLGGGRMEISYAEKSETFFTCVVLLPFFFFFLNLSSSGIASIKYNFLLAHHFHGLLVGVRQQFVVSHQAFRDGFPATCFVLVDELDAVSPPVTSLAFLSHQSESTNCSSKEGSMCGAAVVRMCLESAVLISTSHLLQVSFAQERSCSLTAQFFVSRCR